ncbi:SDR family oxidoreductase [Streptomyces sp. 8K308]|uniref:SDR family oxidoreductase n=1 Tax=Streptomyces sp. 8K308 TaxID=2530388 RepID=UPI002441B1EF|nr:SDR family oxidoreductase [Streptomyces sp. 8K308]
MLLPPSLDEWLPQDHLARFVAELVDEVLDLAPILASYTERRGFPPYGPRLMVRLLTYGYTTGVRSSRAIERKCTDDVAFRYLAAGAGPDYRSISRFQARHLDALAGIFTQPLHLAQSSGMVKMGRVALYGTKLEANASKHKAMSYTRLVDKEQHVEAEIAELQAAAASPAWAWAVAREMIDAALAALDRVDVLHANAAVQVMGGLEATEPAHWDRMYAVNQRAVAEAIRAVVPAMRSAGGGSIILTASLLGITGDPDLPMYGATKGALRARCRSVAAHGVDNIRCNTICPGDVDTEMVREFFAHRPDPDAARAEIEARYPLGRLASPADIAGAALFLASDDAAYVTGTDLVVDGGLLARIY